MCYIHNNMVICAEENVSLVFRAISDPIRRAILSLLAGDGHSVQEITALFSISQPAVTRHLNVLERAGLVSRRKDGRFRYCTLTPGSLDGVQAWLDQTRSRWEEGMFAFEEMNYSEQE